MFNYKKISLPTIFTIFFSYSTNKTESPCANSRCSQCLNCFSYLLPAVTWFCPIVRQSRRSTFGFIQSKWRNIWHGILLLLISPPPPPEPPPLSPIYSPLDFPSSFSFSSLSFSFSLLSSFSLL